MSKQLTQLERLATVEEQTKSIKETVEKLDGKFDGLLEQLDNRYPTRREFSAANWVFGSLIAIGGFILSILKLNQ